MAIYLLIALVLLLLRNTNNKYLVAAVFLVLFLVSAFRGVTVGTDTNNYYQLYKGTAVSVRLEPGFALFFMGCRALGVPYRVILIIFAAIMFTLLYVFTYKEKKRPLMILLFFFLLGYCFSFFNVTRQVLAAGILLFAYRNREKQGNIYLFFLYIVLAMMLHKSAFVGVILFFLPKMKIPGSYIVLLLPLTFIFPFLIPTNEIIDYLTSHVGFLEHYDVYSGQSDKQMFSVNRLLMNIFYMYLAHRYENAKDDIYFIAAVLGLIILNLFPFSGIVIRIAMYFQIAQIVFLTNYYDSASNVDRTLILAYSFVICLFTMMNNIGEVVPYTIGGFS